jgi:rhamnogalacturonan acetylesterase
MKLFLQFVALCSMALAMALGSAAQTVSTVPGGAPVTPPQANVPRDAPLNPALPTVFIVGDSTARNGAELGWADHFASFFDPSRINVANRAVAGRSSRTFLNEGKWAAVLAEMKPGDYLLLQMGHNDSGDLAGAKPRGSLHGIGDETQQVPQTSGPLAGTIETVHTYGWYLRLYIDQARAKGVHTILLTPTIRNIWKDGQVEKDMGYNAFVDQVGEQEHVPVANMAAVEAAYYQALGPEKMAVNFPKDHTHTSPEGAALNAGFVLKSLRTIHSPLLGYVIVGTHG